MKGDPTRSPHVSAEEVNRFYAALPTGESNALVGRDLAAKLGLDPAHADRVLRALAEAAVLEHGLLVSTGQAGYFKPATREEAERSIRWKASQAARMFERVRAEEALIEKAFPPLPREAPRSEAEWVGERDGVRGDGQFYDLVGEPLPLLPDALASDSYLNTEGKR